MLPTIFGNFGKFRGVAEFYRRCYLDAGHDPAQMQVTAPCYIHVRDDGRDARACWKQYLANYRAFIKRVTEKQKLNLCIAAVFGRQKEATEEQSFWRDCGIVGNPDEVIAQLGRNSEATGGVDTLTCYFDGGGLQSSKVIETTTVFAAKVMPHLAWAPGGPGMAPRSWREWKPT